MRRIGTCHLADDGSHKIRVSCSPGSSVEALDMHIVREAGMSKEIIVESEKPERRLESKAPPLPQQLGNPSSYVGTPAAGTSRAVSSAGISSTGPPSGTLRGYWGFQVFDGPTFHLQTPHPVKWIVASDDANALIVGRSDAFHLQSGKVPCVEQITMKDQHGKQLKATWKLLKSDELEVEVPLKDESAGPVLTLVAQSGLSKPDEVPLQAYSEAAYLDHFALNGGDQQGVLTGTRLVSPECQAEL